MLYDCLGSGLCILGPLLRFAHVHKHPELRPSQSRPHADVASRLPTPTRAQTETHPLGRADSNALMDTISTVHACTHIACTCLHTIGQTNANRLRRTTAGSNDRGLTSRCRVIGLRGSYEEVQKGACWSACLRVHAHSSEKCCRACGQGLEPMLLWGSL